jgi:hypothetical protein
MKYCNQEIGQENVDYIHLAEVMLLFNFSALMSKI